MATVAELISRLEKFDPDARVVFCTPTRKYDAGRMVLSRGPNNIRGELRIVLDIRDDD